MAPRQSSTRGFKRTSALLTDRIRQASESRGFAVSRLLTHWEEIVGSEIAAAARPVKVGYGQRGFGATLTLLTTGPQAPLIEMQKETLREKVNAVYGYNAISRVHVTQTAPVGFAEGQVAFRGRDKPKAQTADPETEAEARAAAAPVADTGLRAALERLGRNVLSKQK